MASLQPARAGLIQLPRRAHRFRYWVSISHSSSEFPWMMIVPEQPAIFSPARAKWCAPCTPRTGAPPRSGRCLAGRPASARRSASASTRSSRSWCCCRPELVYMYNDACIPIFGDKHPFALGQRVADVWPEAWDTIGPVLSSVLTTGKAVRQDDWLLLLNRSGFTEETLLHLVLQPDPARRRRRRRCVRRHHGDYPARAQHRPPAHPERAGNRSRAAPRR